MFEDFADIGAISLYVGCDFALELTLEEGDTPDATTPTNLTSHTLAGTFYPSSGGSFSSTITITNAAAGQFTIEIAAATLASRGGQGGHFVITTTVSLKTYPLLKGTWTCRALSAL